LGMDRVRQERMKDIGIRLRTSSCRIFEIDDTRN
jgi:hypothetical protein